MIGISYISQDKSQFHCVNSRAATRVGGVVSEARAVPRHAPAVAARAAGAGLRLITLILPYCRVFVQLSLRSKPR